MIDRTSQLSLCMIVKNEERFIRSCLEQARGSCSELIVVDTGSTDQTREIARECGAEVYEFKWIDDFSAARNFAISKSKSPWILMLDADEFISESDWQILHQHISNASHEYFDLCQINYVNQPNILGFQKNNFSEEDFTQYKGYTLSWLARLFKNNGKYRFVGAVHEHLSDGTTILDGKRIQVNIHHHGQALSDEKMREKKINYQRIGEEKIKSQPGDYKAHHELGIACWELGEIERARNYFEKSYELNSNYIPNMIALGTVCQIKKDFFNAEKYFNTVIRIEPHHPNIYVAMGRLFHDQDKISEAIDCYKKQIRINPDFDQTRLWLAQAYLRQRQVNPQRRPTISVCYITKNESQCLGKSIESVKNDVDEIVVVDTGSSDNTCEIAKNLGTFVTAVKWRDDFSWARNESLKHATSEWILVLDADEVMDQIELNNIKLLIQNPTHQMYFLVQTTYSSLSTVLNWKANDLGLPESSGQEGYFESALVRLFNNSPKISFTGSVHEHAHHLDTQVQPLMTSIRIHHYGKLRDAQRMQEKSHLYHRIGEKKLTEMPNEPHAYYEMAIQYWELKELDKVESFFKRALELDSRHKDASIAYACFLHEQKRHADSLDQFVSAISKFPDNAEAHLYLSSVLVQLEKYDLAIQMMQRARDLGFKNDVAMGINEGVIWMGMGDLAKAEECYLKAYKVNPNFNTILINLALVALKKGELEKSKNYLLKILEKDPKDCLAHKYLGEVHFNEKRIDEALSDFLQAYEIDPRNEEVIAQVIVTAHCLNKMDVVREFEERFFKIEVHSQYVVVLNKLAELYRMRNDTDGLNRLSWFDQQQTAVRSSV